MKLRVASRFGAAALYLIVNFALGGCATTDEEGMDDEMGEQQEEMAEGNYEEDQEGENLANPNLGNNNGDEFEYDGEENFADVNTTDADLQSIINDTNTYADMTPSPELQQNLMQDNAAVMAAPMNSPPMNSVPMNSAPMVAEAPVGGFSGASAGPALPEMGSKMPYVVQQGDTLGKIASRIYGTPTQWREIASLTGLSNPNRIFPGDVVYYQLGDSTVAFASNYESIARQEIVVQQGDTLANLAKRVLGSSKNWRFIWRYSDIDGNPDMLTVGQTLYYVSPANMAASMKAFDAFRTASFKPKATKSVGETTKSFSKSRVAVTFNYAV